MWKKGGGAFCYPLFLNKLNRHLITLQMRPHFVTPSAYLQLLCTIFHLIFIILRGFYWFLRIFSAFCVNGNNKLPTLFFSILRLSFDLHRLFFAGKRFALVEELENDRCYDRGAYNKQDNCYEILLIHKSYVKSL